MKPFTFRLEAVRAMREREEEHAKQTFAEALRYKADMLMELNSAKDELEAAAEAISKLRNQPCSGTEQLMLIRSWRWTSESCGRAELILKAAENAAEQRRLEFIAARQRHEALLKLRERQLQEYRVAARREAEAQINDFITARFGRDSSLAA